MWKEALVRGLSAPSKNFLTKLTCLRDAGEGTQQSFIWGGSVLRSNPFPFYIPFLTKEVSLLYTFHWQNLSMEGIQNGTPFTYLLLNPFDCFKCTVFWIWINHKTRTSSLLSRSNKMHLITLFGLFTDRHDWFPYPFTYFNQWNPYSFIAGDKMSPQTYLGQRYSMSCITRFSPNLSSFLGCPCCTN